MHLSDVYAVCRYLRRLVNSLGLAHSEGADVGELLQDWIAASSLRDLLQVHGQAAHLCILRGVLGAVLVMAAGWV